MGQEYAITKSCRHLSQYARAKPWARMPHLCDYVQLHFRDEEAFMSHISYPDLGVHREEHAVIAGKVKQI